MFVLTLFTCPAALADGTEDLNEIVIALGTDIVGDGVGLTGGPGTVTIDVPAGWTVEQVLLYWNGFHSLETNGADQIIVENLAGGGQQVVNGGLIGGPTLFFANNWSTTYRADVTGLGLVTGPGTFTIEITPSGSGFDMANNGASIVAIVKDPDKVTRVRLADGQDLAFRRFAPPLNATVPQVFNFPPSSAERFMTVTLIAGSVEGTVSGGGPLRPNIVDVTIMATRTRFEYPFNSFSGEEWDHVCNSTLACKNVVSPKLDVLIPPGASSVTIEAISAGFCSNDPTRACLLDSICDGPGVCLIDAPNEPKPASFVWIATATSIRSPSCGDGVVDDPETCDDGNDINDDGCRNDCTFCGDGELQAVESCDPPGAPAGVSGNLCRDDCTVCGDGVVDAGEDCDDGNAVDNDACRNDCTAPVCGDGIVDPQNAETCDPPGDPAGPDGNLCRDDCTVCGDGVLDPGEECDDGDLNDDLTPDACRTDCTVPTCGDGTLDSGETCEPPGSPAGPNANLCRGDCTVCGDGVVDPGEQCDDANTDNNDACRNDCTVPVCGDGILDAQNNESCDPPGSPAGANGNTCRGDCTVCGDGVLDSGEDCDDGNTINDDACRNDCTIPRCGDGIVDTADGETCDPPGAPAGASGNDCRDDCTVCGDGVLDAGEECDDGNAVDGDACRNDCTEPRCGDGIVDTADGETCDPPGVPAGASGNDCRDDCTVCGDGILDAGEECDDGNSDPFDDCGNDCVVPRCDLRLDKQISCDGGRTYVDAGFDDDVAATCIGWDGDREVKVRYVVDTDASGDLVNCELVDSNGLVLGAPVSIGSLAGALDEFVIWETSLLECSAELEAAEPNTATLTCECFEPGSGRTASGSDQANIDCQTVGLEVVKDCGNQVPETDESPVSVVVTNPANPRGASLTQCRMKDVLANFMSDPFDLAPGQSREFDLTVTGLTAPTLNIAWVDCVIVGSGGKKVGRDALDLCRVCPDVTLDKQVSCDGGNTFVDVGNDGGMAETCMGREGEQNIVVRYVANGMVNGYHSDCRVVDSNAAILPAPRAMFGFPGAVFQTSRKDCTAELEAGEPNTATLTCECYERGSRLFVSADDEANIECAMAACGDGVLDDGETCDPPGEPAGASGNDCRDDCSVCGDGVLDAFESCDDGNNNDDDGCRNDCTFCGDGVVDPDEDCDDGNNEAGDGCSPTCRIEEVCQLEVAKTCVNPDRGDGDDDDDDDDGTDCDGRVVSMKLRYTGQGCGATNNSQSGSVSCQGGSAGMEPVSIKVTDRRGAETYANVPAVFLGDVVEATAAHAGVERIETNTIVAIGAGKETVQFHTSCSKPLSVGDQFGSMLLVELTTTRGGTVSLPPAPANGTGMPGTEAEICTIPGPPRGPHCEGKVRKLGLRYLGGGCSASDHQQGDKASCSGSAGNADPVRIVCSRDGKTFLDATGVGLGSVAQVSAASGGLTTLPSETRCVIRDDNGGFLQELRIHTSCSQPLDLGDRFGALEVDSLDTTTGSFSLATDVEYRYRITNRSAVVAEQVTAVDSELGELPGSPIASIAPDETVLLTATAAIAETTTNTVTVSGTLETGQVCEAVEDSATVIVDMPPPLVECTSKIDAMLLKYVGPGVPGPVTVEVLPRSQTVPVVYHFPGGLATNTVVASDAQNGFTVDPGVQGRDDAGSKTTVTINGRPEVHHTSCSTPYIAGLPAPLDNPKGDPSPNWTVVAFTQK